MRIAIDRSVDRRVTRRAAAQCAACRSRRSSRTLLTRRTMNAAESSRMVFMPLTPGTHGLSRSLQVGTNSVSSVHCGSFNFEVLLLRRFGTRYLEAPKTHVAPWWMLDLPPKGASGKEHEKSRRIIPAPAVEFKFTPGHVVHNVRRPGRGAGKSRSCLAYSCIRVLHFAWRL